MIMFANIRQYKSLLIYKFKNSLFTNALKSFFSSFVVYAVVYPLIIALFFAFIGLEIYYLITTFDTFFRPDAIEEDYFNKKFFVLIGGVIGLIIAWMRRNSHLNFIHIVLSYFSIVVMVFIAWIFIEEDLSLNSPDFLWHLLQLSISAIIALKIRWFLVMLSLRWFLIISLAIIFVVHNIGSEYSGKWAEDYDSKFELFAPSIDWMNSIFTIGTTISAIEFYRRWILNKKRKAVRRKDREIIQTFRRSTSVGQVLSEVVSAVSNPVNFIKADSESASTILKKSQCSQEVDNKLNSVLKHTSRCFDIIGKVDNIAPKQELKKDRVLVNKSIEKVVDLVRSRLKRNNIAVQISVDKANPSVYLNTLEFERVLLNLSNNSIQVMTDNARTKNKLTITSQTSGDTVQILVEDTGSEILNTEELFNFFKEARQYNYNDGLGLSLCLNRKTIETCQGVLKLVSTSEKGSKFIIELPKYAENNANK